MADLEPELMQRIPSAQLEKKTLLILASTYPRWRNDPEPGFVHELAKRLMSRFRVIVLAPHAAGAKTCEQLDGVEVRRYRYAPAGLETLVNDGGIVANLQRAKWKYLLVPGFVLMQLWGAWRLVRQQKVHVIHAHWLIPQGAVALALQWLPGARKVPFVTTSHGADLHALRGVLVNHLKRSVIQKAAETTVVSQALLSVARSIGADLRRTSVIPMGVSLTEQFVPDESAQRAGDELLFVGRLVEKKGLRYLIAALPEIVLSCPSVRLTVVGGGPEEARLKAQALELGLQERVTFVGAVPHAELPKFYRRAAVFVAPFVEAQNGDQEGLGLVTIEAIGCGCPVIVSELPAILDVLDQDSCASMLVQPTDSTLLVQRIIGVLKDPAGAKQSVLGLRNRMIDQFDWRAIAERYAQVLQRAGNGAT